MSEFPKKCPRCKVNILRDAPNRCVSSQCPTMPDHLRWKGYGVPPDIGANPTAEELLRVNEGEGLAARRSHE